MLVVAILESHLVYLLSQTSLVYQLQPVRSLQVYWWQSQEVKQLLGY